MNEFGKLWKTMTGKFILDNNLGRKTPINSLINDVLEEIEPTGKGEDFKEKGNSPDENVIQAEVYQALKFRLTEKNYTVERESMDGDNDKPDIEITNDSAHSDATYRIEVKKNSGIIRGNFLDQLKRYRRSSDSSKEIKEVYGFAVIDNPYYQKNRNKEIRKMLNRIRKLKSVTLYKKSPSDLAYKYKT